tara:strand:- start:633 stop:785 length:153 start_codon:yes stop_codon:yes gene_type:complete
MYLLILGMPLNAFLIIEDKYDTSTFLLIIYCVFDHFRAPYLYSFLDNFNE